MESALVESRLHERLAVLLAREIVSGRMSEGSVFPSVDALTEAHRVSRTVVREALQALATAGVLRIQHGKRTVVNGIADWRFLDLLLQRAMQSEELPEKLVRDLYEARRCIEMETARLAAMRAGESAIESLRVLLQQAEERLAGTLTAADMDRFVDIDRAFHGTIGEASGNVVLARAARDAHRGLLTTWHLEAADIGRLTTISEQHREIAAAVEKRDPEAAAAAMRVHVEWSLDDALEHRPVSLRG